MSDIVERLRYCCGPWSDTSLADDARNEIERLRALLLEAWNLPEDSPFAELVAMQRRVDAALSTTTEAGAVRLQNVNKGEK